MTRSENFSQLLLWHRSKSRTSYHERRKNDQYTQSMLGYSSKICQSHQRSFWRAYWLGSVFQRIFHCPCKHGIPFAQERRIERKLELPDHLRQSAVWNRQRTGNNHKKLVGEMYFYALRFAFLFYLIVPVFVLVHRTACRQEAYATPPPNCSFRNIIPWVLIHGVHQMSQRFCEVIEDIL